MPSPRQYSPRDPSEGLLVYHHPVKVPHFAYYCPLISVFWKNCHKEVMLLFHCGCDCFLVLHFFLSHRKYPGAFKSQINGALIPVWLPAWPTDHYTSQDSCTIHLGTLYYMKQNPYFLVSLAKRTSFLLNVYLYCIDGEQSCCLEGWGGGGSFRKSWVPLSIQLLVPPLCLQVPAATCPMQSCLPVL